MFGTIRFVGNAEARYDAPSTILDEGKSLSKFFASSASDPVLCGGEVNTIIEEEDDENGVLWECRQAGVGWFGLTVLPIFMNRIEKNPDSVVVSLVDSTTEVQGGGRRRLGNTLASAMKLSKFEGRNAITWEENTGDAQSYTLDGSLKLTVTIELPPLLPLPPGFNKIGSMIVQSTCKGRLRQNLSEISDSYLHWASQQQQRSTTSTTATSATTSEATEITETAEKDNTDVEYETNSSDGSGRIRKRDRLKRKLGIR